MKQSNTFPASKKPNASRRYLAVKAAASVAMLSLPAMAFAKGTFADTGEKVCTFFTNINSILDMVSIAVVTLAVIIAGYQIAFAHKRISDVAPILIGGVLIGVASQVAGMLIGDTKTKEECKAAIVEVVQYRNA